MENVSLIEQINGIEFHFVSFEIVEYKNDRKIHRKKGRNNKRREQNDSISIKYAVADE